MLPLIQYLFKGVGEKVKVRKIQVIIVFLFLAGTASASNCGGRTPCGCGDTLVSSQMMWYDLDCPGRGITINQDYLTLDCAGHVIEGIGVGSYVGIKINRTHNVTVKNCFVEGFGTGISFDGGMKNTAINNNLDYNWAGIGLLNAKENIIKDNNIDNHLSETHGILVRNSSRNSFVNNIIKGCIYGIFVHEDAFNNIFWFNHLSDNIVYNARQSADNYWNSSDFGNYWDDFESNSGYPDFYEVNGPVIGIDWLPNIYDCSDGTDYGTCSANKPMYCNNGNLISMCKYCGCPIGLACMGAECVGIANLIHVYAIGG